MLLLLHDEHVLPFLDNIEFALGPRGSNQLEYMWMVVRNKLITGSHHTALVSLMRQLHVLPPSPAAKAAKARLSPEQRELDARIAKWVDVIVDTYSEATTAKASKVLCVVREWIVVVRTMVKMVESAPDVQAKPGDVCEASKEGLTQRVEQLLDYGGAELHETTDDGLTALHHAASNGHLTTTQALLHRGADIHAREKVHCLLLVLSCPAVWRLESSRDSMGMGAGVRWHQMQHCPLALAVAKNHTDVVRCLLDAGADPSKIGPTGQTALHVGASCGSVEATKLLLSYSTVEVKIKDHQVWPHVWLHVEPSGVPPSYRSPPRCMCQAPDRRWGVAPPVAAGCGGIRGCAR